MGHSRKPLELDEFSWTGFCVILCIIKWRFVLPRHSTLSQNLQRRVWKEKSKYEKKIVIKSDRAWVCGRYGYKYACNFYWKFGSTVAVPVVNVIWQGINSIHGDKRSLTISLPFSHTSGVSLSINNTNLTHCWAKHNIIPVFPVPLGVHPLSILRSSWQLLTKSQPNQVGWTPNWNLHTLPTR